MSARGHRDANFPSGACRMFTTVAVELSPLDSAISEELEQELARQAGILMARLSDGRERLAALEDLSAGLREQLEKDELMLRRLDGLLGNSPEPPLDSLDARLRERSYVTLPCAFS